MNERTNAHNYYEENPKKKDRGGDYHSSFGLESENFTDLLKNNDRKHSDLHLQQL